jgi:hemerythrin-like domain-containing protein
MDEHAALVDLASLVRRDLTSATPTVAMSRLAGLVARLNRHVQREEDGVFRALRTEGEFIDEVKELQGEHRQFAAAIASLDTESSDFGASVTRLLDDLEVHVERENLGIFPVSVVTLGASGWTIIDEAHTRSPSFLLDPASMSLAMDPT